jgi:hypothetical protein
VTNQDTANIGATSQATRTRADLVGNPFLENPTPQRWFDTGAFATPRPYTFGTAGRNLLRSDALQNLDLSLFREDRITERVRLQFRVEGFNVLNHPSFGVPNAIVSASNFGRISSTVSTERQLQLGLKVIF